MRYAVSSRFGYEIAILELKDHHDPEIKNKDGKTVAMLLVQSEKVPPKEWQHDPEIKDNTGCTVAMLYGNKVPSPEWIHDPEMMNSYR